MKKSSFLFTMLLSTIISFAQTDPIITAWLKNITGIKGSHYVNNNPTAFNDADSANVQTVLYSNSWTYIRTKGIPAYTTGPFLDGNPSIATAQNSIFKLPRVPQQNMGTPTNTTGGNIGLFINGVALFDYRDGVSWRSANNSLGGGPLGGMGDGVWNRDAVVAERAGFDCSKGHPAMGNYHHHQNPSAFRLDLSVISNVCNIYAADGLYAIDSTRHSPLIGFAYDGFPIYGAYGYKNADGTGGIVRMKSSYSKRNITTRTTYYNGTSVTAGPAVSTTYPLGYFREDYQYNTTTPSTPDYLDEHNGRICVTPEFPSPTYCYFATVDANWNSAYPYAVGPTFYGRKTAVRVNAINEPTTVYLGPVLSVDFLSFKGVGLSGSNQLYWTTTSERNNDHFDIEYSGDGLTFTIVGSVSGAITSVTRNNYTFNHKVNSATGAYYRLKQVDKNGNQSYSKTIYINTKDNNTIYTVFPNPASDLIAIQRSGLLDHNIQVIFRNMKGQTILKKTLYQGTTISYLDITTCYEGVYTLTIVDGNFSETHKIEVKR
jgi:hypothetical protein